MLNVPFERLIAFGSDMQEMYIPNEICPFANE